MREDCTDAKRVEDEECISTAGAKPSESHDCLRKCQCVTSNWTPCSVSCGCGQQTRNFSCIQNTTSGGQVTVSLSHCENDPTVSCPPQERQQCEEYCYEWTPKPWGSCSAICGPGEETRDIYCMRKGCNSTERVGDTECENHLNVLKPHRTQPCNTELCDLGTFTCRWATGDFSDCSRTFDGLQSRKVHCQCTIDDGTMSGSVSGSATLTDVSATVTDASDGNCEIDDIHPRPVSVRSCGQECTTYSWVERPWSTCSKACTAGKQTRAVVCGKHTAKLLEYTSDSDCEAFAQKPVTERDCDFDCRYVTGVWGNCSVSCGGGMQWRSVDCEQTGSGKTVLADLRDCQDDVNQTGLPPPTSRVCNENPCAYMWKRIAEPCSHSCGEQGLKNIFPLCVREANNSIVDDVFCSVEQKPRAETESCNRNPCPAQ